jgi:hypothetical protein
MGLRGKIDATKRMTYRIIVGEMKGKGKGKEEK